MNDEAPIKICLYGYSGVGCNQLKNVTLGLKFEKGGPAVTVWSFVEKTFIINKKEYLVNIWNGPGQEKYRNFLKIFLKDANIVILVYDITYRKTFEELSEYINIVRELLGNNFIGAIVGNKIDLFEYEKVSEEEARKFAEEVGFKFAIVSAKVNIKPFIKLLKELIEDFIEKQKEKKKIIEEDIKRMNIERKNSLIINYKLNLLKYLSK